jgi:hypothetical protein
MFCRNVKIVPRDTPPRPLPESIKMSLIDQGHPMGNSRSTGPIAQLYRETLKASGLSRNQLRELLLWSNNSSKTYRHIDALLDGKCEVPEFENRFIEVLGINDESVQNARKEQIVYTEQCRHHYGRMVLHEAYRDHGPYLQAIRSPIFRTSHLYGRHANDACNSPIDMNFYPVFVPPSAAEISQAIASSTQVFSRLELDRKYIESYYYHRLPDEIHLYDIYGNLLQSGDTSLIPIRRWRYET